MKPTCSFRQCAIWRSLSSRRLWPNTRISPPVALSMAAIRCNSVDLPEPEGPISATNSLLWIWMSMFLSATTWNSSRMNSFVRLRVSIMVSLMWVRLLAHSVAVLQRGRRVDDEGFAADESLFDAHALAIGGARLDGARDGPALQHHEDLVIADGGSRHDHNRLRRRGGRVLPIGEERHAGVHFGPQKIVRMGDLHFHLHGGLLAVGLG